MNRRSDLIALALVTILASYMLTIGATFNGILMADLSGVSLVMLALTAAVWLLVHWRQGWRWFRSPLDGVFLLWGAAFVIALLANTEIWRRSLIALWYMGLYLGLWYLLADALANGRLRRAALIDGLLISGLVVLIFGFLQFRGWLAGEMDLPRPVSVFGNPNYLGAFLVVLIPLAAARALTLARFGRSLLAIYTGFALLLLFLTFSRGAWLGMAAGGGLWLLLILRQYGLLKHDRLRQWWQSQRLFARLGVYGAGLLLVGGLLVAGALFVRSFSTGGREAGLRTEIYAAAAQMFSQKPLTGYGLFSFGRELVQQPGVIADKPHSHAHSAPLHIAAELGLPGLAALLVTLGVIGWALWRHWQMAAAQPERPALTLRSGAFAAVVAFGGHQLVDMPAMMPAIALTGLLALLLALLPDPAQPLQAPWRRRGHPVGIVILWAALVVTGWWGSRVYGAYVERLQYAVRSSDYIGAAAALQPIIDADPNLSLYRMQQAFLLGLSAQDTASAALAADAYADVLKLEPGYALLWANRAQMLRLSGDLTGAVEAMRRAVELDPENWRLRFNLGDLAETAGDLAAAQAAYEQVLADFPDAALFPQWNESALRQRITDVNALRLSAPARVAHLLAAGRTDSARLVWNEAQPPDNASSRVISALLAADRETALQTLAAAESAARSETDWAWVYAGRALIGTSVSELQAARSALRRGIFAADDEGAINIAYAQFLRLAFERWVLPGLFYPVDDPALLHLLDWLERR